MISLYQVKLQLFWNEFLLSWWSGISNLEDLYDTTVFVQKEFLVEVAECIFFLLLTDLAGDLILTF